MIVVADTSPLRYLIVLEQADVLRDLFQRVVIPEEVWSEFAAPEGTGRSPALDGSGSGVVGNPPRITDTRHSHGP